MAEQEVPGYNQLDLRSETEKQATAARRRAEAQRKKAVSFYSAAPGNLTVPLPGMSRRQRAAERKKAAERAKPGEQIAVRSAGSEATAKKAVAGRPTGAVTMLAIPLWMRRALVGVIALQLVILGLLIALVVWGTPGGAPAEAPAVVPNEEIVNEQDEAPTETPAEEPAEEPTTESETPPPAPANDDTDEIPPAEELQPESSTQIE